MLNNITNKTTIHIHTGENITRISFEVGMHPKDAKKLLDVVAVFLRDNCSKTIASIDAVNKEYEYISQTLIDNSQPSNT